MTVHRCSNKAPSPFRRDLLRNALPGTIAMLNSDRADLLSPGLLDDYLALRWIEASNFGWRLTRAGELLCGQVQRHG